MDISVITTYRCNMECQMCNIWQNPSNKNQELKPEDYDFFPDNHFNICNITGGEPLMRSDLEDIIEVMFKKSKRVVISTAGWHVERILKIAERFPKIGVRVSIEGLSVINDELRGRKGGFDRGLKLLLGLRRMGIKDVGFGMTVNDRNYKDLEWLHELAKQLNMEFATATFHNSFYFHKYDNEIVEDDNVTKAFRDLIFDLLKEKAPKSWYRAFFNLGLINYIKGNKRMLPCEAGSENFFIDPYGEILPCNGMEAKYWYESMGNIKDFNSFDELWNGERAKAVRKLVSTCPKNCWMIGTASPVMKKYIKHPTKWVLKNKIKSFLGKEICTDTFPRANVGQDPRQGDLRVPSKEEIKEILMSNSK